MEENIVSERNEISTPFSNAENFKNIFDIGKIFASSQLVPQNYQGKAMDCTIAVDMANRIGVSPMMVMQNLYVIQGRPSWSAQFLIASVNGSGKYDMELQYDEKTDKDGKPFSCQCWTMKDGRKVSGPVIDMEMAKAEGWTTKSMSKWKTMPQIMLRYRAASFFARMNCPEMTLGFYTKEEAIDGDFKEYPLEEMRQSVEDEIKANANTEDFVEDVPEENVVEQTEETEGEIPSFAR